MICRCQNSRQSSRRAAAKESFSCAAECIGSVVRGMSLFAVTRGQWSMLDGVLHLLDCVGRAEVSLWTYSVADYDVQVLTRLRIDERVSGGRLVIDASARRKNAAVVRDWRAQFGSDSVRYVLNHSKMARVTSASGFRLLLRGSMNLNCNPRFEQCDLTEGGRDFDLVKEIEDGLPILSDTASGEEIYAASRVSAAFGKQELAMFRGVKSWQK